MKFGGWWFGIWGLTESGNGLHISTNSKLAWEGKTHESQVCKNPHHYFPVLLAIIDKQLLLVIY